jgi:TPR repeat protein
MGGCRSHAGLGWLLLFAALSPAHGAIQVSADSLPLDSRAYVERSVGLIEEGSYTLARGYLAPALIDYRLTLGERSRAYYLRGYSFYAQKFYVSAGKDYTRALEFNSDNPAALAALGGLHARGLGMQRDEALAYQLFSKAAHAGHVDAQFHVGYAELEGRGTDKNLESARRWLNGAADQGHVPAMTYMARSFRKDLAETADPQAAQVWYEKAYAAGAVDALVALAFMYQSGEFGEPDDERAAELFAQAADAGSGAPIGGLAGFTEDHIARVHGDRERLGGAVGREDPTAGSHQRDKPLDDLRRHRRTGRDNLPEGR